MYIVRSSEYNILLIFPLWSFKGRLSFLVSVSEDQKWSNIYYNYFTNFGFLSKDSQWWITNCYTSSFPSIKIVIHLHWAGFSNRCFPYNKGNHATFLAFLTHILSCVLDLRNIWKNYIYVRSFKKNTLINYRRINNYRQKEYSKLCVQIFIKKNARSFVYR